MNHFDHTKIYYLQIARAVVKKGEHMHNRFTILDNEVELHVKLATNQL